MNFNEIFFMMAIFLYVKLLGVKYYRRKVETTHARRLRYNGTCTTYEEGFLS